MHRYVKLFSSFCCMNMPAGCRTEHIETKKILKKRGFPNEKLNGNMHNNKKQNAQSKKKRT